MVRNLNAVKESWAAEEKLTVGTHFMPSRMGKLEADISCRKGEVCFETHRSIAQTHSRGQPGVLVCGGASWAPESKTSWAWVTHSLQDMARKTTEQTAGKVTGPMSWKMRREVGTKEGVTQVRNKEKCRIWLTWSLRTWNPPLLKWQHEVFYSREMHTHRLRNAEVRKPETCNHKLCPEHFVEKGTCVLMMILGTNTWCKMTKAHHSSKQYQREA